MAITLSKKAEQFVESEVAAGRSGSTDEVIEQALELYQLKRAFIESEIEEGLDDMEAGRSRPFGPAMLQDIKLMAESMQSAAKASGE